MNNRYIVVENDEIVGEFSQLEQADLFMKIRGLRADAGDKIYIYELNQYIEVLE